MKGAAKVHSVDAIRDFKISYCKLTDEVQRSLDQRNIQIRKFLDWLNTDQRNYWIAELKVRKKHLDEANAALSRKRLSSSSRDGAHMSAEVIAVRKAKERIAEAEKKLQAVQHWSQVVERAVRNYEGPARQLSSYLQTGVPKGVQMIDGVLASLDAYTQTAPPASAPSPTLPTDTHEHD